MITNIIININNDRQSTHPLLQTNPQSPPSNPNLKTLTHILIVIIVVVIRPVLHIRSIKNRRYRNNKKSVLQTGKRVPS